MEKADSENEERIGWLCPRCQQVNAPDVARCTCKPTSKTAELGTATTKNDKVEVRTNVEDRGAVTVPMVDYVYSQLRRSYSP